MGRVIDMKGLFFVTAFAVGVGCAGSADEEDVVSTTEQDAVSSYVALSDATTPGGTQGFFIFSPWGTVNDTTVFSGTPFAFATTRMKGEIVHLSSCNSTGPTEDAGPPFATLSVTVAANNRFQISRNTATIGTGLVAGQCYRVKLKLDNFKLGFSDVQMVVGTAAATAPFHRLVTGSNFTLRFRTESSLNTDTDTDTVPDWRDNCPNVANTNQLDTDQNGVGDACEPVLDADGDGIPDAQDACFTPANLQGPTNCPNGLPNDCDGDGTLDCQGDACPQDATKIAVGQCGCGIADTDTDLDGTADCNDQCATNRFKIGANVICGCNIDIDSDGNGTIDACATVAQVCAP